MPAGDTPRPTDDLAQNPTRVKATADKVHIPCVFCRDSLYPRADYADYPKAIEDSEIAAGDNDPATMVPPRAKCPLSRGKTSTWLSDFQFFARSFRTTSYRNRKTISQDGWQRNPIRDFPAPRTFLYFRAAVIASSTWSPLIAVPPGGCVQRPVHVGPIGPVRFGSQLSDQDERHDTKRSHIQFAESSAQAARRLAECLGRRDRKSVV